MNALFLFVSAFVMFMLFQVIPSPPIKAQYKHPFLELLWAVILLFWGVGSLIIMAYVVIRVLVSGAW